jgi:Cu(I)/Ag(I) efflux system membrane protein CusA/SilA
MAAVPFSLVGGFWLVWLLGHAMSVATAVGFIALAGVAAEFGVVMLVYLENASSSAWLQASRTTRHTARRHPRRRRAARAAQGHDGGRRDGGPGADHVGHGTGSEVMGASPRRWSAAW